MLPSCIFVLLFWGSVSFKTKTKQSPLTTKAVWWTECLLAYRYVCTGLIWGLWSGCIHQDGTCHGNGDGSVLERNLDASRRHAGYSLWRREDDIHRWEHGFWWGGVWSSRGYIYFPNLGARCDQLKMKIWKEQHDWKHCRIEQHHSYEINTQKAVRNILMHSNRQAFQHFKGKCLKCCGGRKGNCAHRAVHLQ